ncbi:MAG: hypothetical protein KGO81_01240 [Bacteroidota bacterium]|nr:hypothetical protein [Bacteroidota bacterium]
MLNFYSEDKLQNTLEDLLDSKYFKVATVLLAGVAGIYLLGHLFKITAHTVRGYNELKSAFKNI